MFKETVELLTEGVSIYELYAKSRPNLQKLFKKLTGGEVKIAVFGAGGTGKTTLGRILSGQSDPSILSQYEESYTTEPFKVNRDISSSLIIAAGQKRREDQWIDLLRQVSDGKVRIIINVVASGYHSFGSLSYTQDGLYQQGMSIDEFMEVFTTNRGTAEIRAK
jgi:translation initiation factor RLI1